MQYWWRSRVQHAARLLFIFSYLSLVTISAHSVSMNLDSCVSTKDIFSSRFNCDHDWVHTGRSHSYDAMRDLHKSAYFYGLYWLNSSRGNHHHHHHHRLLRQRGSHNQYKLYNENIKNIYTVRCSTKLLLKLRVQQRHKIYTKLKLHMRVALQIPQGDVLIQNCISFILERLVVGFVFCFAADKVKRYRSGTC